MKLTIFYYEKEQIKKRVIDHREWKEKCPDSILKIYVHYQGYLKKLEGRDGYICYEDEEGLVWFGGLRKETLTGHRQHRAFLLEEIVKMPIKFGKAVDNDTWSKVDVMEP